MTPIQKFRTHEEARQALWLAPGDPRIPKRLRRVLSMAMWLYPLDRARGVFKFRSIEEASTSRRQWRRRRASG